MPRKSVVRLTDRPDMTLDVYRGRKTTIQQLFFDEFLNSVQKYSVSILEMRRNNLSMNSCIRYFFGLFYSILSVFTCKVKQQ